MKVVFDTNVLLDSLLARPGGEDANRLLMTATRKRIKGIVTANSITDFYYLAKKDIGDAATRRVLTNILSVFTIAPLDGDICTAALGEPMSDYEDAVLTVCAEQAGADYIATRDRKFRSAQSPVPVRTPTELIRIIEGEET